MSRKTLIIGALGQIGSELILKLRSQLGDEQVIASDIREDEKGILGNGPFEQLDILDKDRLLHIVKKHNVSEVYLMAALLSATAEQKPQLAWNINMNGLFNVLNLAKENHIKKIFWPSSIAVFGPSTPRQNTPQRTIMEPSTVYGISKQAGERWCEYYFNKYNVDVRSIRYPGLISYNTPPGGGTTDYAVDIFYKAIEQGEYQCFLSEDTILPMLYMPDAIDGTIKIMEVDAENVKVRSSYNIAGFSFSPKIISQEIKKHISNFEISYQPDYRQAIANSWPQSIEDKIAKQDWSWKPNYLFEQMVEDMIMQLQKKLIK